MVVSKCEEVFPTIVEKFNTHQTIKITLLPFIQESAICLQNPIFVGAQ